MKFRFSRLWRFACWLILIGHSLRAEDRVVIESDVGADAANWSVQRGGEFAAATWISTEDETEGLVGLLEFNFGDDPGKMAGVETKGTERGAGFTLESPEAAVVRIWCRSSQAGRQVRLQLIDANDERFITTGWKMTENFEVFEFPLSTLESHWGGDNNGQLDQPIKVLAVQAVRHNVATRDVPEMFWIKRMEILE